MGNMLTRRTLLKQAAVLSGLMVGDWMQIEGARPKGDDVVASYRHNLRYLKDLLYR